MAGQKWTLYGFMDAVRAWMRHDPPPGDLLVKVAEFGAELEQDPELDARREHGPLYFREIPGTEHGGRIVSITFELTDSNKVHCQTVSCVPHPQAALFEAWPPPKHH